MRITKRQLRRLIKETLQTVYEVAKEYVCPPATQDVDLNTENRNATREDHDYGPMNPLEPSEGYWEEMAANWKGAKVDEAAGMRCANCVAFDISPRMRDCMPISQEQYLPPGEDDTNQLEYLLDSHLVEGIGGRNTIEDI